MEIEVLNQRIEKKKADIAKIQKRIDKWTKLKNDEKAILKNLSEFITDKPTVYKEEIAQAKMNLWNRWDPNYQTTIEQAREWVDEMVEDKKRDCELEIKHANRDLEEANNTLNKYYSALEIENQKQQQLSGEKISQIWDFLLSYKANVMDDVEHNLGRLISYFKASKEEADYYNNHRRDEDFREKDRELRQKEKAAKAAVYDITWEVYGRKVKVDATGVATGVTYYINKEKLESIMDKEIESLYLNLINRVNDLIGVIRDASGLHVGLKGDLEGTIIGENGTCRVWSDFAGGYNQDVIVNVKHGQRLHVRCYVRKVD